MAGSDSLSADEWEIIAEHRKRAQQQVDIPTSGPGNRGDNGGLNNGTEANRGTAPEPEGPPEDAFGFRDEYGGLRNRWAGLVSDDNDQVDPGRKPEIGELRVRPLR
ncbi:TPA_asm: hypothetical protein [Microviridae sp.]|nr:TPA_asm: hypothetical protein [Microviridae sp.]DAZ92346.1 TPA_asm: hypothetical protein [Microviridae sp.]